MSWEEGEYAAGRFAVSLEYGACRCFGSVLRRGFFVEAFHGDWVHASFTLDEWCVECPADVGGINGGGHDDQTELGAQQVLCLPGECECNV